MNRLNIAALILFLCPIVAMGQVTKLTGTIIGTKYSVDYGSGQATTVVNTKASVFDGKFDTFFASYDRSQTWVGLDLGQKCVITKVGWSPRNESIGPGRCCLALFEGANDPYFHDAIPLYIIDHENSTTGRMNYANVNVSRGFRYVRYVGPNNARCNLSELAFYGYKGEGDDTQFYQLTNLPTVTIHTATGEDPTIKGKDFESNVAIIYDGGTLIQEYPMLTRVRGNASADFPKKPYRIKYNDGKSHHIMKGGSLESPAKAKKWTLISNYGDKSLMRNILAFELSRRLQMIYTPYCQPVDVIMNGEYKGCYQLCDQVSIDPHRVPVVEMESTDVEEPLVSGGYLIEIDAYAYNETSWFNSNRGTPVTIKEPDEDDIVPQQYQYIKERFNLLEQKLYASDYTNEETGYRSVLDATSFLRHFLVGEASGNTDTYWSVYMYKNRMDDQFHVSPCWDFDLAFDNDGRTFPVCNLSGWVYNTAGSYASGMRNFVNRLLSDTKAMKELQQLWADARNGGLISTESLIAYVDSTAQVLDLSQQLNFKRWNILNTYVHQNPRVAGTYEGEVQYLRDFLAQRIPWMDNRLSYGQNVDDGEGKTFEIATPTEFIKFIENVNKGMIRANARLTADINLMSYRSSLKPIGTPAWPYSGTFDGQGHVIKYTNCMLFGTVSGATIRNVGLSGGSIVSNAIYADHTGTLVGCCTGDLPTTISHCYSNVRITSAANDAGGLVGKLYGTLEYSYYTGTIRSSSTLGGLIGSSHGNDKPAKVDHSYVLSTQLRTTSGIAGLLAGWLHDGSSVGQCYAIDALDMDMFGNLDGTLDNSLGSKEDFASGRVCWELNGMQSLLPQWYQTLGEDASPLLDDTHGVVIYTDGVYSNDGGGNAITDLLPDKGQAVEVYDARGQLLRHGVPLEKALQGLPRGIYIVGGQKIVK